MIRFMLIHFVILCCCFTPFADEIVHPVSYRSDAGEQMLEAAKHFMAAFGAGTQTKMRFSFQDEERLNFHFVPKERQGLTLKAMDAAQKNLAHQLLHNGLSRSGYNKALRIMYLDKILFEMEGRAFRDSELYYFSIFGEPEVDQTWGWRVEGHHLSVNFTIHNGEVVSFSPLFMGANPAIVPIDLSKGLQTLPVEEELARKLVRSLNDEQRQQAVFAETAPADIVTGAQKKIDRLHPEGIGYSDLQSEQKEMLARLLSEYVFRVHEDLAEQEFKKIMETPESLFFAWAGGFNRGEGHYYRIQGKHFVLEYDNTQNGANHVHTVWRDFDNDFGLSVLQDHYRNSDHHSNR